MESIVVAGASLGGLRTAEALRRAGYAGTLTIVGDETHPPYDRPPLSKQVLDGRWEPARTALRQAADLEATWRLGTRCVGLDLTARHVALDDGTQLPFDGLVIATGARPRTLPGMSDLDGVFTLRSLDDALALRAAFDRGPRVAVIGAGFIGAEVAAAARRCGLDVTVVEALSQPLGRVLGADLGARCARLHRDNGTTLRLGIGVRELRHDAGRVTGVELDDGSTVAAEVVVVGIGVVPAVDWLVDSGLELRDGVVCDEKLQAVPGVVAVGDCSRWMHPRYGEMRVEHWTNTVEQAEHAADTLLGGARPFAPLPYFWSDQYDVKLQYLGYHRPGAQVRMIEGTLDDERFVAGLYDDDRLTAGLVWGWPARMVALREQLVA